MLNCVLSQPVFRGIGYEDEYEKTYLVSVLETIFKFTRDIYIITDNNFTVKYSNSKYINRKTDIPSLLKFHTKNLSGNYAEIKKTLILGKEKIKADVTIAKIFTNSKNPDGYLLIIKDKTKYDMANICLDRVMNFLQHELKTSISAQSLGIKLLKKTKNNDEILNELENSTETIFRMLKNVIYEIDTNEKPITLNLQSINIKNFFEKIKSETKNFMQSRNNSLVSALKSNFDFKGDKQFLMQVMTTLLLHANDGCQKTPSLLTLSGEQHKGETIIKICGYFNPPKRNLFYELKKSKNTLNRLGFDNGLYLCSKIIKAHNGKITVSTKNFISAISIILPN